MAGPHLVVTTSVDDNREPPLTSLLAAVEAAPTPLTRIAAVRALARALEVIERDSVTEARSGGSSWTAVAEQLGVTKQAAARRFGPARDPEHVAVKPDRPEKRRPPGRDSRPTPRRPAVRRPARPHTWRPLPGRFWMVMLMVAAAGIAVGKWILPT